MALTRSQIMSNAPALKREEVNVPEWNGSVIVRELNGAELEAYLRSVMAQNGSEFVLEERDAKLKLLMACIVDDDGNPLFSEADRAFLEGMSGSVFLNLANVALTINGLRGNSIQEAKDNLKNDR